MLGSTTTGKSGLLDVIGKIVAFITIIATLFLPAQIDNAAITIDTENITAQTQEIRFTLTNTTNKCIANACRVIKVEKDVDGQWIEQEFGYFSNEIAFTLYPNQADSSTWFKVANLTEGEYRFTVEYNAITSLTKSTAGYSVGYFTVN